MDQVNDTADDRALGIFDQGIGDQHRIDVGRDKGDDARDQPRPDLLQAVGFAAVQDGIAPPAAHVRLHVHLSAMVASDQPGLAGGRQPFDVSSMRQIEYLQISVS